VTATSLWLSSLPAIAVLTATAWAVCTVRRNVGLVDIFWSLFLLLAAVVYAIAAAPAGPRATLVLALVAAWAVRLAAYLTARNWNAPEDHRYQAIRARNQPNFEWKSLYLVFGLQGLLAWIISAPLAAAVASPAPLGSLDWAGAALGHSASSSRASPTPSSPVSAAIRRAPAGYSTVASGAGRGTPITLASAASGGAFSCSPWPAVAPGRRSPR